MFTLLKQEGAARRGQFKTVHGTIQTPVFMNVGTSAAIKGGVSSIDLKMSLKLRWSFAIPIICTSDRATTLYTKWADFTSS